jgi:hypothetical protein
MLVGSLKSTSEMSRTDHWVGVDNVLYLAHSTH